MYKRIYRELQDIEADFHSLRTCFKAKSDASVMHQYFVIVPNDGPMCHLPLIGELIIPEQYPDKAPVIHLFSSTGRYNVDVYRGYMKDPTHSTMCFDILSHGWKRDYTLTCLFASLMQSVTIFKVPQEYGEDKAEFTTMEKLASIEKNLLAEYTNRKRTLDLPMRPEIPMVAASILPQKSTDLGASGRTTVALEAGRNNFHMCIDLAGLHHGTVFSIVLTNDPSDLVGKKTGTILVRNGVTASAAVKKHGKATQWFYHGKPMVGKDVKIYVSITRDKFTLSYTDDKHPTPVVHGDTSVMTGLEKHFNGSPRHLCIFMKHKFGPKSTIAVKPSDTHYTHATRPPIYFGYFFDAAAVAACYPAPEGMKPVANPHVTLGFHKDFTETTLATYIAAHYVEGETRDILVSGVCYDDKCVCLRVATDLHCFPGRQDVACDPVPRKEGAARL